MMSLYSHALSWIKEKISGQKEAGPDGKPPVSGNTVSATKGGEYAKDIKRILVPAYADEVEGIRFGLAYLLNYLKEIHVSSTRVMLFIPALGNLEHTTLAEALGPEITRTLQKEKRLKLSSTSSLELATERTISPGTRPDAVFAVYADMGMMAIVDTLKTAKLVVAIPRLPDALDAWVTTWGALVHGAEETVEF
jgi:hypothetical protein